MVIYDDKGRVIQTKSTNLSSGTDVVTTQYGWQGLPLVTAVKTHNSASQPSETLTVVTKTTYDELGRVTEIKKKQAHSAIDQGQMSAWHTISELEYDALGQVKTKKLAPGFNNNTGLETLDYDYNIRGWLLGANRDYISETTTPDDKHFGFDLGYDKKGALDYDYLNKQYNGNIGGTIWRSAGDREKRKYDYNYDNANRLMLAYFGQYNSNGKFSNDKLNFNAKMGDGSNPNTAYDANGNIKLMYHYGFKFKSPEDNDDIIDKLSYEYQERSNKLLNVTDTKKADYRSGDFRDGSNNESEDDYDYDNNGNLTRDANKNISSITYNHLNLPSVITFTVNGTAGPSVKTITYSYDAEGNKLKKITHEDNATISLNGTSYSTAITNTVTYLGDAVFESRQYSNSSLASLQFTDALQFIAHEEGRIRPVKDANNDITGFTYDYFIKDHLTNVRMVLTEEQQQDIYPLASLESSKVATEGDYYDIQPGNIVDKSEATGITDYPNNNGIPNNPPDPSFEAANSAKLYRLNSTATKAGLGITLKVMAGDKIDVFGKSYYFQNTAGTEGNSPIPVLDLLAGFLGTPSAPGSGHGLTAADINIPSGLYGIQLLLAKQDNKSNAWPTNPRAFINVLFFDEQFKSYDYRVSMAGSANAVKDHYSDLQNIAAEKNGYVYIYCSNESPVDVFFDNLQVVHTRGQILEEAHYYPYGMKIANISSRAAGALQNRYLYQGDFSEFDEETGYNEFYLRHYDPQIGRWTTADPYGQFASPYIGMGNSPAGMVDPDGGASIIQWPYLNLPGQESLSLGNILGSASFVFSSLSVVNKFEFLSGRQNRPFDWYRDMYGTMQYNPNVRNQGDLVFRGGGIYVGRTHSVVTERGDKIEYRMDGSILFDNENDAYQRMITIGATREAMAVDIGNKMLYLPDYKNLYNESFSNSYGYLFSGNKIYDPVIGQNRRIFFSAHTHLSLYEGNTWGDDAPSWDDIRTYSKLTPNIPFITMGDTDTYGYFGSWKLRSDGKYNRLDIKYLEFMRIPTKSIFTGFRRIIQQNRKLYGNF